MVQQTFKIASVSGKKAPELVRASVTAFCPSPETTFDLFSSGVPFELVLAQFPELLTCLNYVLAVFCANEITIKKHTRVPTQDFYFR